MMDENSAGCASEGVDLDAAYKPSVVAFEDAQCIEYLAEDTLAIYHRYDSVMDIIRDADGRIIGCKLHAPALIAELRTALALPAPTISQDVPAPAAVTAICPSCQGNGTVCVEGEPDRCDICGGTGELATLAALSAATPLQSDLAADNARLAYMAGYRDGFHDGNASGEDSWWDQVAAADGWQQYRAALQGADNHE